MYYLYDLEKTCMDVSLANTMAIVRNILNIIHIIGPILCIVSLAIIFTRKIVDPDNKKIKNSFKNISIATIVLFIIPYLVNGFMFILDDKFDFSECWKYSEKVDLSKKTTYISISNQKSKSIYTNPDEYEKGKPKPTPTTNNENQPDNSKGPNNSKKPSSSSNPSSQTKPVGYTGKGLGKLKNITIKYNVKDSKGRCGTGKNDHCSEVAIAEYADRTVEFYMGYQNNSGLLGGSCRAHAFTCAMNAVNNTYYSTLDLQNYMKTIDGNGVFKGRTKYDKAINHFGGGAVAYFEETSIKKSYQLAKQALENGQPVMIFVAHDKCSDLAGSHHALLLLGYDENGNVIFLDSCAVYRSAKKRNLEELILGCMSGDGIARSWMRMVIFSYR